jgi:uncharacterized phage protein (TIGR02218 family)
MKPAVVDSKYRAMCLRIVPRGSSPVIRLTDYPRDLTMSNGQVYQTASGYEFTGYSANTGTSPGVLDFEGIAGIAGITREQLSSGQYDNARCFCFAADWRTPVEDAEPMLASFLGKVTFIQDRYRVEEMSLVDALNQAVGKTYTASCTKRFGGQEFAGCKVNLAPITVTGTLTAATSALVFRDSSRTEVADYFGAGTIAFTSGANSGLPPKEIKSYAADGTITLHEAFYYAPEVGDAYSMEPGCRKRLSDCRDKWNNVANFGGFPYIPVSSTYSQFGTK